MALDTRSTKTVRGEAGVNDGEPDDAESEGSAELTPGTELPGVEAPAVASERLSRLRCPPPHRGPLLRTVRH